MREPDDVRQFGGRMFWTSDVALSVLLAQTARCADDVAPAARPSWLPELVRTLRVSAAVTDFGLALEDWPRDRLDLLVHLLREATGRLTGRGRLTAEEAGEWRVLGDDAIAWRGAPDLETAGVAAIGEAVVQLIRGTLPPPPPGTWWFYDGEPHGPRTIPMRERRAGEPDLRAPGG